MKVVDRSEGWMKLGLRSSSGALPDFPVGRDSRKIVSYQHLPRYFVPIKTEFDVVPSSFPLRSLEQYPTNDSRSNCQSSNNCHAHQTFLVHFVFDQLAETLSL